MEDDRISTELGKANTLPSKKPSIFDKIYSLLNILIMLSILVMISLAIIYLYNSIFWKPYDDASNHLLNKDRYWDSVDCEGNKCTITFDSNVSNVVGVAMTSSMLPIIGGNDVIICLNKTPKPGDIVSVGNILHMVYKIEDGTWLITKGENNLEFDRFKFPISQIDCVVGVIIR